MSGFLARRDSSLAEKMDDPACNPVRLENTYRSFPRVNRWISRRGGVYREFVRPLLSPDSTTHLLDVGSGGGDIALALRRLAERDGFPLEITGVDPDPRAMAFARRFSVPGVTFREASASDLVRGGEQFDIVVCNHVLHHLEDAEVPHFLAELETLARRRVVCSDIERSRVGYALFSAATAPFFRNSWIREDGLVSIRRSFRRDELRGLLPPGWRVERRVPFRLLVLRDVGGKNGTGRACP